MGSWGSPRCQPHARDRVKWSPAQRIPGELDLQEGATASLSLEASPAAVWLEKRQVRGGLYPEHTACQMPCSLYFMCCAPRCGEAALVLSPGRNPSCGGTAGVGPTWDPVTPTPAPTLLCWGAVCTEAHAGASASHLLWANVTRQRVSCQSSAALFRRAQVLKFFPTLLAGRAAPHQAPLLPCLEVAPAPVRLTQQEGESREVAVDSLACWKLGFQERPLFCSWKKNQAE